MTAFAQSQLAQPAALPPEPTAGAVICWQQRFGPDSVIYTYAAVHIAYRGWYVSNESETPYTWPELIYWLIGQAPVYVATAWQPL